MGLPRIAQQIALAFAIPITKDVVRRVLAVRYRPAPDSAGPSWLTVLGHAKDSLWSLDLFRCESAVLRTHWVLVVMDHCTRRIVGCAVHRGVVDGVGLQSSSFRAVCRSIWNSPPTRLGIRHRHVPGALDEIPKPVVVALLRAGRGRHGNDHRPFPHAAQLLADDGERPLA